MPHDSHGEVCFQLRRLVIQNDQGNEREDRLDDNRMVGAEAARARERASGLMKR